MTDRADYIRALLANEAAMDEWRADFTARLLRIVNRLDKTTPFDALKYAHLQRELDALFFEAYVIRLTALILAQTGAQYDASEEKMIQDIASALKRAPGAVIRAIRGMP